MAVRVLIADSSGITRDIMRNHLECGGCQVVAETETVAQTIDFFRTTRPDVVTLDIGLRSERGARGVVAVQDDSARVAGDVDRDSQCVARRPTTSESTCREGALECIVEPFDSYGLERMWRRLSDIYPELKRRDEAASGR